MKEYDLLKIGISEKKKRGFEFFKTLVKLRSLQAERVDSSSKKIEMLQQVRWFFLQCTSQFVDVPLWMMETVTFVIFDVGCRRFFRWVRKSS